MHPMTHPAAFLAQEPHGYRQFPFRPDTSNLVFIARVNSAAKLPENRLAFVPHIASDLRRSTSGSGSV